MGSHEPTLRGTVQCDIAERMTSAIGNPTQGPGDVAFVSVFEGEQDLERMRKEYRESMVFIQGSWNKAEAESIKQMLIRRIGVDGIALIVLHQLLDVLADTYLLY